jgi:5-formyltetrahydrofolate cyclo-ligase
MVHDRPDSSAMKAGLRREALRRRRDVHARSGATAGNRIAALGMDLVAGLPGLCVSGYLPILDEIDPLPLMERLLASSYRLALPVVVAKDAALLFRRWVPGDTLADAPFGLREPLASSPALLPDILLVPLAAFDSAGTRIGYGGGYYDRTLELYRASRAVVAIGIAFDEQEVPPFAPEPHDQRLDYLLTPTGVRTFGA